MAMSLGLTWVTDGHYTLLFTSTQSEIFCNKNYKQNANPRPMERGCKHVKLGMALHCVGSFLYSW